MSAAAGLALVTPDGQALFLKRSEASDFPGTWCLPGGALEGAETPLEAAVRETREETGWIPDDDGDEPHQVAAERKKNGYATFKRRVGAPFIPTLDAEHTAWAWAPLTDPPQPVHPGLDDDLKTIAADAAPQRDAEHEATIRWNGDFDMPGLLGSLKLLGQWGSSRAVEIAPGDAETQRDLTDKGHGVKFGWDGDGADKIVSATIDGVALDQQIDKPNGADDKPNGESVNLKTLYVHRRLLNAADVLRWAKDQGFAATLEPDDLHVTVAFSRDELDWRAAGTAADYVTVPAESPDRVVKALGDDGAVVLSFACPKLSDRWREFRAAGASWNHPRYQPHLTITYEPGDVDLKAVAPYAGVLEFGPEVFAEVKSGQTAKYAADAQSQMATTPSAGIPAGLTTKIDEAEDTAAAPRAIPKAWRAFMALDAGFQEDDHPRAPDGKFGSGGSSGTGHGDYRPGVGSYAASPDAWKINKALRANDVTALPKRMQETVSELTETISETRLPEPVVGWRGIGENVEDLPGFREGATVTDKAFVSTTSDPKTAAGHAGVGWGVKKRKVLMKISMPAGAQALQVENSSEGEIIVQRGSAYKINRIEDAGNHVIVHADLVKSGEAGKKGAADVAPALDAALLDPALAMDRSLAVGPQGGFIRHGLALDEAATSVRAYDQDGRLHVKSAHISKACINPYVGKEIPGWQDLGLEPDKVYRLLRDPAELARAAPTFNGLPLLIKHIPTTADDHASEETVGALGTNAAYQDPYLDNELVVWTRKGLDAIESSRQKELSAAYHYRPDMTPGTWQGQPYDGVMRDIRGNHVALVEEGRAGSDVVVGDSAAAGTGMIVARANGRAPRIPAPWLAVMALDADFREGDHPRGESGKFGSGGGGKKPATKFGKLPSAEVEANAARIAKSNEQAKATLAQMSGGVEKLPTKPGTNSAYDLPDGSSIKVQRRPDGSYYAAAEKFDTTAPDAASMLAKLNKMGAKHAGWESSANDQAEHDPKSGQFTGSGGSGGAGGGEKKPKFASAGPLPASVAGGFAKEVEALKGSGASAEAGFKKGLEEHAAGAKEIQKWRGDPLQKPNRAPGEAKFQLDEKPQALKKGAQDMALNTTRRAGMASAAIAYLVRPLLAQDARLTALDLTPAFAGIDGKNWSAKRPALIAGVSKALAGKLAQDDAGPDDVAMALIQMVEGGGAAAPVPAAAPPEANLDATMSPEEAAAMEAASAPPATAVEPPAGEGGGGGGVGAIIQEFLQGKVDDSVIAELVKLLEGGGEDENEENPDPNNKTPPKGAEDEPPPFNGMPKPGGGMVGKDEKDMNTMVSKGAMDAAIKREVDKALKLASDGTSAAIKAAVDAEQKRQAGIIEAMEGVRPIVGKIAIACDSAEAVYRAALEMRGIKHDEIRDVAALRTILDLQPRAGSRRELAQDAAPSEAAADFDKRYPTAGRIGLV